MAIDSAEKRRSAAGVLGYFTGGPGVTPNASPDQEWRQQAGYGYSGVLVSSVTLPTSDVYVTWTEEQAYIGFQQEKAYIDITSEKAYIDFS